MADVSALTRTIDAFDSQRQALLERITSLVVADFERFDGWYSPRLVDEVTAQAPLEKASSLIIFSVKKCIIRL